MICQCEDRADAVQAIENALLRSTGFFKWGHDAWIQRADEGTVYSTADALALAVQLSRGAKGVDLR